MKIEFDSKKNTGAPMKKAIDIAFEVIARAFDLIPFLSKFGGYRAVLALAALGITYVPEVAAHMSPDTCLYLRGALITFAGLALNAKGRPGKP